MPEESGKLDYDTKFKKKNFIFLKKYFNFFFF